MRVDQARQEPGIPQVDDLDSRSLQLGRRTDLRDAIALDEDGKAVPGRVRAAVDQVGGLDQDALGWPGRRRRLARRLGEDEEESDEHGAAPWHGARARATERNRFLPRLRHHAE